MKLAAALQTALLLCSFLPRTQAQCPLGLSGSFTIGLTGNYPTLTAAVNDLHVKGLSGPITLELQSGYTCTTETFPITLQAAPCGSQSNTITIRPQAGAPTLTITSNNAIATVDLNNGSYYTLEGRPGGTDTAHLLTIANTNATGTAIRFINGASYNQLNHLTTQGVNNGTGGGVITLAGTDSAATNSYNRIDSCTVTAGAAQPVYGILASDYHSNKHNVINGCNVSNVGGTSLYGACGICVRAGYDSITITNNSVYQTAAYNVPYNQYAEPWAYTGLLVGGAPNGGAFIENNYVGGSQPKAAGAPMQLNDCSVFTGITALSYAGAANASQVIGNTITNISFCGPYGAYGMMIDLGLSNHGTQDGSFNGICANNIIGNTGAGHSIQCPYQNQVASTSNVNLSGITVEPGPYADPIRITGNRIGGFQTDARLGYGSFIGIDASNAPTPYNVVTIDANRIGDDSTTGNILFPNPGYAYGIRAADNNCGCASTARDTVAITNNHIAGISAGTIQGIQYFISTSTEIGLTGQGRIISNNTLTNLNGSQITGITFSNNNDVFGPNGAGNVLCTGNTLVGLGGGGSGTTITGISFSSSGFANTLHCTISGNRLISFDGSALTGIIAGGEDIGVSTVDNNMIDLGLHPNGNPLSYDYSKAQNIYGINGGKGFNILHNSIYIHVPGNAPTPYGVYGAGIIEGDSSGTTGIIMNNILSAYYPARDNSFSLLDLAARHIQSDYNIFHVQGHGYIGFYATPPQSSFTDSTLADWQNATGGDQHSQFADPLFVHPDDSWPNIDLHVQQGTPAEGAGTSTYTTLTDIDGKLRAQYTPVDIGADAGNFKGAPIPPPADTTTHDTTAVTPPPAQDTISLVRPYPNPFTNTLAMVIHTQQAGTAYVSIMNLSGKLEIALQIPVNPGDNTVTVPMDTYPDGYYAVRVEFGGKRQTREILKKSN